MVYFYANLLKISFLVFKAPSFGATECITSLTALKKLVISVSKNMFYNPSAIDVWISVNNKAVCIPSNQTVKIEKTSENNIVDFR